MYPDQSTLVPTQQTAVSLGLPAQILGIPTWVWIVGGAIFFLKHKGKL